MEETQDIEEDKPYKSKLWKMTRLLLAAFFLTLIIAFFKPLNIWVNRGVAYAHVISIYEIYNMDGMGKSYNVQYEFTVNGKPYTGKSEMKMFLSYNPFSPLNSNRLISASDVSDIEVVYCRHWPEWFYVKRSVVEWK